MPDESYVFPSFDDLPAAEGRPRGALWGFFDRNGKRDELGSRSCMSLPFVCMPG